MTKPIPKILLTGSTGLIGSSLAQMAEKRSFSVTAATRAPNEYLRTLINGSQLQLDLLTDQYKVVEGAYDTLIHCATANDRICNNPADALALGLLGTQKILDLALRLKIPLVIVVSTIQVLGTNLRGQIDDDTPPKPESFYGLNHLYCENLCEMYSRKHGMSICAVRPTNVFGLHELKSKSRAHLVPHCFVSQCLLEGEIILKSSGKQNRNFISTRQLATQILQLLEQPTLGFRTVICGSRFTASIYDIAELTASIYHSVFRRTVRIHRDTTESPQPNDFELSLAVSTPTREETQSEMIDVISKLFENFTTSD
jgi:nucleoside-diphosphate-sugar epimerase